MTIKNGDRGASSTPNRTVKRERVDDEAGPSSRKKRNSGRRVTIDLTADSDDENVIPLN